MGDQNTTFFHAMASQRWRKNRIVGLNNAEGVWQKDQGIVEGIILDYFEAIFTSNHPTNFKASLSAINSRVSTEMNEVLDADLKPNEIRTALGSCH